MRKICILRPLKSESKNLRSFAALSDAKDLHFAASEISIQEPEVLRFAQDDRSLDHYDFSSYRGATL
jgi:hypothetical protein